MGTALRIPGVALTQDQGRWKRVATKIAREVLAPRAVEIDRCGAFPTDSFAALADAGLLALTLPKRCGGAGQDLLTSVLVLEELAQGCGSTAMCYSMHLSTLLLLASGSDAEHVAARAQAIGRGEQFGTLAMSEPGAGNRVWHTDSYAVADGTEYVFDAKKSFVTSAGHASYYVVPVRANCDSSPHDISVFIVDGRKEGVRPQGTWDGMGMRGNASVPVHFDKVRVLASDRIGTPTAGFAALLSYSFPSYQLGLSAVYLGIAQGAFDIAMAHVQKRVHSDTGKTLAHVETVQRHVAEMKLRLEMTRSFIHRLARLAAGATALFDELSAADLLDDVVRKNHDDPFFAEIASVKVAACEAALEVTQKALQVCGGTAYKRGHPVERHYRDARAGSLMGPADDTLKILFGSQLLGVRLPWQ